VGGAQVAQFKKLVETLGTAADTRALRTKLKALRDSIQASARDNSAAVKQLSSAAAAGVLTIEVRLERFPVRPVLTRSGVTHTVGELVLRITSWYLRSSSNMGLRALFEST